MAGIDYLQKGKAGKGAPAVAISVCISGVYEDDADHHAEGEVVWYTGERPAAWALACCSTCAAAAVPGGRPSPTALRSTHR